MPRAALPPGGVGLRAVGSQPTPDRGEDAALVSEAVVHPEQTVRHDVELLHSSAILPPTITISGHVYDVDTGLITTIIPAAPLHATASGSAAASA